MMRILITGGSSYLGQHLTPQALACPGWQVGYTYFQQDPLGLSVGTPLDLRQETAVTDYITTFRPDVIIHTAGSNRTPDMTQVIVTGTRHVTQAAQAVGSRLIHLSTDSLFNGRSDTAVSPPYNETASPSPINAYGEAKAIAETIVQQHPNHVIIRTSLIYSLHHLDHGTAWMIQALRAGQPVKLFNNQRRNPIWVNSLSQACLELATHAYQGILNVAGQQSLTRAEFSLKMLDWWQIKERDTLTIGPAADKTWPLDCELCLTRALSLLQTPLPGVDAVLAQHHPTVS